MRRPGTRRWTASDVKHPRRSTTGSESRGQPVLWPVGSELDPYNGHTLVTPGKSMTAPSIGTGTRSVMSKGTTAPLFSFAT